MNHIFPRKKKKKQKKGGKKISAKQVFLLNKNTMQEVSLVKFYG